MNIIKTIRAEIERRIKSIETFPFIEAEVGAYDKRDGKLMAYRDLLSFLDTLQEQEPKGLDKSAEEYDELHTYQKYDGGGFTPDYNVTLAEAFKAGAEWAFGQFESVGTFPIEDARGGYWPTEYFIRKK